MGLAKTGLLTLLKLHGGSFCEMKLLKLVRVQPTSKEPHTAQCIPFLRSPLMLVHQEQDVFLSSRDKVPPEDTGHGGHKVRLRSSWQQKAIKLFARGHLHDGSCQLIA